MISIVATGINQDNALSDDLPYIGILADFERVLVWAWLETQQEDDDE